MATCCCARHADVDGADNGNCGDCRSWQEELYWKRFQSFYFCQILSSDTEFRKHLEIPKKFADNASSLLPPKVILRGPSRASWSVLLTKRGDDLFLTDGWEEFVKAYSLQATDILIFKFDGVSAFDILIFHGQNMCEKESAYFVNKCRHENAESPKKRPSSEANLEEHDDGLSHRATKQAREEVVDVINNRSNDTTHFYSRSRRKKLLRKHLSSKANLRKRISPVSKNISKPSAEHGQSDVQNEPSNNEPLNTELNGSGATEASPQDTSRINGSILREETSQSEKETSETCSDEATPLRVATPIDSPRNPSKASSSKRASSVRRPRNQPGLNIVGEDSNFGSPRYVPEEGKLALEMARKHMTDTSFMAVMRPTSVCRRYILTIPPGWFRDNLSPKSQDVYIRFGDKTFLTRLCYSTRGQISGGWRQVVAANQLKLYDVCLFHIASRNEDSVMLDATVFRANPQREPVSVQSNLLIKGE